MSDRHDDLDLPVDPTLDALLRRALATGGLTPQQRDRRLEELDLTTPELELPGGIVPVSGAPKSLSFDSAAPRGERRSRRELFELAAVLAVIALGAGLLLAQLWDGRSDPATRPVIQPGPFATPAPFVATATPAPPSFAGATERLYVVSRVLTQAGDTVLTSGRVTALDPDSGRQEWSLYLGHMVDALLSRDGATIYVAASRADGMQGELLAVDAIDGTELWRIAIPDRVWWSDEEGPAGLALSRDGTRLYLLSCSREAGPACDPSDDPSLAIYDASSGRQVAGLAFDGCLGTPYLSPDARALVLACEDRPGARVVDLESGELIAALPGHALVGSVASPDGRWLYVISDDDGVYQAAVIDMHSRELLVQMASVALVGSQPERFLDLVTISPDGSRLFIGVLSAYEGNTRVAKDIFVIDTETLQSVGRMTASPEINARTLAPAADNRSVFAAHAVVERDPGVWARSTITHFGLGVEPRTIAVLEHQQALRLLSWTKPAGQPISRDWASLEACPAPPYTGAAPSDPRQAAYSRNITDKGCSRGTR
ncbi:MAG TPA: PQQ-binding-like beta-propeller repeat protein [Thermomicrobiales bacterium]|nr:PQQ-binding-like beta-propeller repeat protein [Thermomicrobiales bacterium]